MAGKVTIDAYHTVGRPYRIAIDPDATVGAQLGENLTLAAAVTLLSGRTLPAGYVLQPTDVLNGLIPAASGGGSTGSDWSLLTSIPPNVTSAANLATVGLVTRQTSGAWVTRSLAQPVAGIQITNANGDAGNPTFVLANDLAAVEGLATAGIAVRTGVDAWTTRSLTAPAAGITISNSDAVAGSPTFALANDLAGVEGLATTGLAVRTAADTWATRTLAAPAAGLSITNPAGLAGNPTFALANDLAALEALASTGIAVRSGTDAWVQRTLAVADVSRLTVTNGSGVSGNPTFDLATLANSGVGALRAITRDAYGRISGDRAAIASDIGSGSGSTANFLRGDLSWSSTLTNFYSSTGSTAGYLFENRATSSKNWVLYATDLGGVDTARLFRSGGVLNDLFYFNEQGSLGVGSTSFGSGLKVIAIANATTAPSTNPVGGGVLYADGGALKWRGSSGSITTLGPA